MNLIPEPPFEIVYDAGRPAWWMRDAAGEYVLTPESGARRRLRQLGFSGVVEAGKILSPLDAESVRLQREGSVAFAGPVAGHVVGVRELAGRRVLVTNSVEPLAADPSGTCNTLNGIFVQMLGNEQFTRFCLWAHYARRRLLRREWHPLPALALVGEAAAGKSYLQSIITRLLGGRVGKPAQFMQGTTNFNGELFGAEHLAFEDESARCDSVSRRSLGEKIKEMLFCKTVHCHSKNRPGVSLEPIWALTLSINSNPEHLKVLPTLDQSLTDKILMLRCEAHPRPVPPGEDETEWLTRTAQVECPAFAATLDGMDLSTVAPEMLAPRTKVAGWQHPDLLRELQDMAPEAQLLRLVDDILFATSAASSWTGSADELSRRLRESRYGNEAGKLLSWPTACGVYLGRLESRHPNRVILRRTATARSWTIHPSDGVSDPNPIH